MVVMLVYRYSNSSAVVIAAGAQAGGGCVLPDVGSRGPATAPPHL